MSSHHTVREKQEPALLIADGIIAWNSLFELLEWSPTVVALDGAARRIMEQGIKVDWVIGDFDSELEMNELLVLQPDVRMMKLEDQDAACLAQLHCDADVNAFMEMMVKAPLKSLFDSMAKKLQRQFAPGA